MKRLLVSLLTATLAINCFACANQIDNRTENPSDMKEQTETKPESPERIRASYNVCIRDNNNVDKCFWDDDKIYFNDFDASGRQKEQSAELIVGEEYDMFLFIHNELHESFTDYLMDILDFSPDDETDYFKNVQKYYEPQLEYDTTKFEIKKNPSIDNHFILKVLQPCKNEIFIAYITPEWPSIVEFPPIKASVTINANSI